MTPSPSPIGGAERAHCRRSRSRRWHAVLRRGQPRHDRGAGRGPEPDRARGQGAAVGRRRVPRLRSSLMRLCLVPKLKQGMDARYGAIRGGHERRRRRCAPRRQAEVAEYEAAARRRPGRGRRPHRGRPPPARGRARRRARRGQRRDRRAACGRRGRGRGRPGRRPASTIDAAVGDVASRAVELAIGQRPDADAVRGVVDDVIGAGVGR